MRITFISILLLCTSFYSIALAEEIVPCLEKNNNRWKISKDKSCVQLNKKDLEKRNKRLLKLRYYVKVYEPQMKREKGLSKKMVDLWKTSLSLCEKQIVLHQKVGVEFRGISEDWRKVAMRYKGMKMNKRPWYEHPVFVATVSVAATVGAVAASVAIYNGIQVK